MKKENGTIDRLEYLNRKYFDGNCNDEIKFIEHSFTKSYNLSEHPLIYPTPHNELEFEWKSNDYVLVVSLEDMTAELIGDEIYKYDMSDENVWKDICEQIKKR